MKAIFVLMIVVCLAQGLASAQQESLVDALKKQSMELALNQGKLEGPGAAFLFSEGNASQFVLVGEDHGLAEVPEFCSAYFHELKNAGFANLAVEVGPDTARILEKYSREKAPVEALRKFDQTYYFSIPFFNWQGEAEMLTSLAAGGVNIWGLDQEFIFSTSFELQHLVDLAPDENARKTASDYLAQSLAGDKKVVAEKNPGAAFMVTATEADFQKLAAAFQKSPEATRTIEELRMSWEIYAKNFQNKGRESNLQRSALMKKHFHEYYDRAAVKKTLFKFGAYHSMRGRSLVQIFDLGNHVSELAEGLGSRSFHVLLIVVKGTVNAYRPFSADPQDKAKPYEFAKELDTADVGPLVAAAPATGWSVIDLRPCRTKVSRFGEIDRGLEQILWGYDAVVLIPEGHAATLLN